MRWIERSRWSAPNNPDSYLLESRVFGWLNQTTRAMESLHQASRLGAERPKVGAYTDVVRARRGELDAAERLLVADSSWLPPRDVLAAVARSAMLQDQMSLAQTMFDQWEEQFPRDPARHDYRGRWLEALEEFDAAADAYEEALGRQPGLAHACFRLGVVRREQRDFAVAQRWFRGCYGSPYEEIGRLEAAECHWQQGDHDAAWQLVEPLLDEPLGPLLSRYLEVDEYVDDDRAALVAARIRSSQGEHDAATEFCQRVLEFNHRNFEAQGMLADHLR